MLKTHYRNKTCPSKN